MQRHELTPLSETTAQLVALASKTRGFFLLAFGIPQGILASGTEQKPHQLNTASQQTALGKVGSTYMLDKPPRAESSPSHKAQHTAPPTQGVWDIKPRLAAALDCSWVSHRG